MEILNRDHGFRVLASDGKIYCVPADGVSPVLVIDTENRTLNKIGSTSSEYSGCSIGQDGKIISCSSYLGSGSEPKILVIDPVNQSVNEYDTGITGLKIFGLVLAPDGYMYGLGEPFTGIYKINPTGDGSPFSTPWCTSSVVNKF